MIVLSPFPSYSEVEIGSTAAVDVKRLHGPQSWQDIISINLLMKTVSPVIKVASSGGKALLIPSTDDLPKSAISVGWTVACLTVMYWTGFWLWITQIIIIIIKTCIFLIKPKTICSSNIHLFTGSSVRNQYPGGDYGRLKVSAGRTLFYCLYNLVETQA